LDAVMNCRSVFAVFTGIERSRSARPTECKIIRGCFQFTQ
jgi:hypothetical protein